MSHLEEDEETELKIRESFQLLTQGVEMVHYDIERTGMKKHSKLKKILWLDPDYLRLCIAESRPRSIAQNLPHGIYLRDIAETRIGANAYDFIQHNEPPEVDDFCLSLIGTEATLCLQLPTKFSRDWFFERFTLLANDVWTPSEKTFRAKLKWTSMSRRAEIDKNSNISVEMRMLLENGIKVQHHKHDKKILPSILSFNVGENRLLITPANTSFFNLNSTEGLNINDIIEIRPGTHSYAFAVCDTVHYMEYCLSLIGTERTIDIQLASRKARDLLIHKLKLFVDSWATNTIE